MWPKTLAELTDGLAAPQNAQIGSKQAITSLCTDSRKVEPGELFVAIKGDTHDGHSFVEKALKQGAVAAVVESSWLAQHDHLRPRCIAVQDTTSALRSLAKSFRSEFSFPVFAVGGSNGKTTTKEMLACLLSALAGPVTRTHKSENGFLGLAMTLTQKAHHRNFATAALVAEIGIDDVGAMSQHLEIAQPDFAMLTALGPEHLAGLGSWDKAVEEELILFRQASLSCKRIWQCAEKRLRDVLEEIRPGDVLVCESSSFSNLSTKAIEYSQSKKISTLKFELVELGATQSDIKLHWTPSISESIQTSWNANFTIPLPGAHNAHNFALAMGAASLVCHDLQKLTSAWSAFTPPEMRSRVIKLKADVTLYDDCYNASPASMDAAFDSLLSEEWKHKRKILVLGDMLDLGEESKTWHLKLVEKLLKFENSDLCLFGTAMYDVYKEIETNHLETLRAAKIRLQHAGASTNPTQFMSDLSARMPGSVVLVKGSRGMDLGRFVKSCEEWCSAQG